MILTDKQFRDYVTGTIASAYRDLYRYLIIAILGNELERFTIEDIIRITGCGESTARKNIKSMLRDSVITEIEDEPYHYQLSDEAIQIIKTGYQISQNNINLK